MYLEVHPELSETRQNHETRLRTALDRFEWLADDREYRIDWELVTELLRTPRGVPIAVGILE